MLSNQQSGQDTSDLLHQSAKRISTKARNRLGGKVKQDLTEVKMSGIRKRAAETDKKKTYRCVDRVTVLGLVCEKIGDGEGMVDDDCFPDDREVWEVTHVREEDVETTGVRVWIS
jgi:hypothetical protein